MADTITRNSSPTVAIGNLTLVESDLERPVEHTLHPQGFMSGWLVAFGPVRVAVSGRRVSPPLFESMQILGRVDSLDRIDRLAALLD